MPSKNMLRRGRSVLKVTNKALRSFAVTVLALAVLVSSTIFSGRVYANTDSPKRSTWTDTEKYCKSLIGKMAAPTCADFVSTVMRDCSYYPGSFKVTASSSNLRAQLVANGYSLVGKNNTYRKYKGIDSYSAIKLGDWVAGKAKPGDILIWVKNTTVNYDTTAAEHVSIYAGTKTGLTSHGGKTTWPAHYSDPGAGKTVKLQAIWAYANTGTGSGRGYGVYIYRKPAESAVKDPGRWEQDENGYKYFDKDGVQIIDSWRMICDKWYYLGEDGYMLTGLKAIGGKYYYFADSGEMATGWIKIDERWMYFSANGDAVSGWINDGGKWYYLGEEYVMMTGFVTLESGTYYMNSSGAMVTGWRYIDDKWYFFAKSGEMVTGWKKISKEWYYFDTSGVMLCNTVVDGYELGDSGAML